MRRKRFAKWSLCHCPAFLGLVDYWICLEVFLVCGHTTRRGRLLTSFSRLDRLFALVECYFNNKVLHHLGISSKSACVWFPIGMRKRYSVRNFQPGGS